MEEEIEQTGQDLIDFIAYPFLIHNKSVLSVRDFVFSISLDALLCAPSKALLLLKCGIYKGLLSLNSDKQQVSLTFNYSNSGGVKVLFKVRNIKEVIETYCKEAKDCCDIELSFAYKSENNNSVSQEGVHDKGKEDSTSDRNRQKSQKLTQEIQIKKKSTKAQKTSKKNNRKNKLKHNNNTGSLEDYF